MYYTSKVTGMKYEHKDVVYFRNLYQCTFYIKNGATIVDVFCDKNNMLVFCFPRDEHKELIKLWMDNKKNLETKRDDR